MDQPTAAHPCPICGRPAETPKYRPFCSARCKQVDLSRWLGEVYRVRAAPSDPDDGVATEDDEPEE